jgi:putative ABC transport system permease protein
MKPSVSGERRSRVREGDMSGTEVPRGLKPALQFAGDIRHGARMFARAPGFAAVALLTIALGIGATTTIFSLINAVLLRSLPYGDADRLVYMWTPNPHFEGVPREMPPPFADVLAWREMSRSFTGITALTQTQLTLRASGEPMRVAGARVLGDFFETLRSRPQLGRTIEERDEAPGQTDVAVIGDALWRSRFGGRRDVIGRVVEIESRSYRIVGVMPPAFTFPGHSDYPYSDAATTGTEIWIPAALTAKQREDRENDTDVTIGRLRPGVSLAQAQAEISAIEQRLAPLYPPEFRGVESLLVPLTDTIVGPVRPLLRILMGAVCLVLLIACSNVANLLMARAAGRVHEIGVRAALGAERGRLVRQMMSESLLLAVAGGALGTLLAVAALKTVSMLNPGDIPRFEEAALDVRVLLFTLVISIGAGLLFGILPALSASVVDLSALLREGGARGIAGSRSRAKNVLIVTEVALAVVLLAGAGLLIRSYLTVLGEDKGFMPSTLTMKVTVPEFSRTPQQTADLFRSMLSRVRALPGVESAGSIDALPLAHRETVTFLEVEGHANRPSQTVNSRIASSDYFSAMQIRLIAGRFLNDSDIPVQAEFVPKSVVVSESFAKLYYPRGGVVGSRLRTGGDPHAPWITIAGVVADVRHSNLEAAPQPIVYQPNWTGGTLAIRSALPSSALVPAIRVALGEIEHGIALSDIRTMDQRIMEHVRRRRFQTILLAAFAGIAVFLALIGVYGLLSYAVRQRTAEIGVRMALGASRGQVLGMIVRQGLMLTAAGLVLGLAVSFAATRLIAGLLYGVHAADPVTFVAVPAFILLVAGVGCVFPAWRAARIDPVTALRYQ